MSMRVQVPSKAGPAPMSLPSHTGPAGGWPPTLASSRYSSHSFSTIDVQAPVLQAKLQIGAADDPLEQEADRVAEQVTRMPEADVAITTASPHLARKCAACEEKEEEKIGALQTKATGSASGVIQPRSIRRACAACEREEAIRRDDMAGANDAAAERAARAVRDGGVPMPRAA